MGDVFVINLPTGTYTLTLTGAGEDGNLTGDLDITRNVTIAGAGASATIINANNLDRVLDTRTGNIRISGVTIKGGHAPDGAVATGPAGGGTPSGNNGSPGAIGTVGTGGGVALYGGTLNVKNTILANNSTPAGGQGPDCYGMITSQGYNLIRTLTNCTLGGPTMGDITGQDPLLNALADNGGGTLTHGLQFSSPARDAGDPAGCRDAAGNLLLADQRGFARIGGRCDMGAFEWQGLFLPLIKR